MRSFRFPSPPRIAFRAARPSQRSDSVGWAALVRPNATDPADFAAIEAVPEWAAACLAMGPWLDELAALFGTLQLTRAGVSFVVGALDAPAIPLPEADARRTAAAFHALEEAILTRADAAETLDRSRDLDLGIRLEHPTHASFLVPAGTPGLVPRAASVRLPPGTASAFRSAAEAWMEGVAYMGLDFRLPRRTGHLAAERARRRAAPARPQS